MSLETDLIYGMFKDDLQMADQLLGIGDFAMAAEALASAIGKIHQIAAASRSSGCAPEGQPKIAQGLNPGGCAPKTNIFPSPEGTTEPIDV